MKSQALGRHSALWAVLAALLSIVPFTLLSTTSVQLLVGVVFALGMSSTVLGRTLPRPLRLTLTILALIAVAWTFGLGLGARNFGRDAASALLVVMLGMKLLELQTLRDARAATVFSIFAIMAAFLQDQSPTTLLLAVVAATACIATIAQLAEAESPEHSGPPKPAAFSKDLWQRTRSAMLLGAISLPLALVGFFLFPRLAQPMWGMPANSTQARIGLSEDMSPGDISQLYIDDTPVMRVSFNGPLPAPNLRYFRGPVLNSFDGRRWTRGFYSQPPEGDVVEPDGWIEYEVEQEPTERRYLFALDLLTEAPSGARFDWGRALTTAQPQSRLSRHSYRSATQFRFEPELKRTLQNFTTQLPEGFNPRALALAQEWRRGGDVESVINRALQWFNAEFTYTLEPDLLGRDSVDDFLFETKRGYCEHFSSSFVVLMRAAGIPARVVTGYQGGYLNPLGNYLVVRNSDAHAWAEVWLEGRGWVRVDPTSAVAPERIERGSQTLAPESALSDYLQPMRDAADWLRRNWNDLVLGYNASRQQQLLRPLGIDKADWQQLAFALLAASSLAIGLTLWVLLRKPKDRRPPVMVAWHTVLAKLGKRGYCKPPHRDPAAWAETLLARHGSPGRELRDLARRYESWCYEAQHQQDEAALIADLRAFKVSRLPKQRRASAAASDQLSAE